MGLTPRQHDALRAIRQLSAAGVAPSFEAIRASLNLASKSGVHRLVHGLAERRLIEFVPYRKHSIRVIGEIEGLDRRSDEDLRAIRERIDEILRGRAQ